ncbi:LysR family transcriptional regulator [Shouchella sp. JSM 1781072]|uniref:LysR family transcriptional regulator n=1 Tax=Bacillaceae TaxID=186817 RepID=UPI00159BD4BC|nr:LysR family transcriptional regulator [Bacillus sp. Marseille-P3800]
MRLDDDELIVALHEAGTIRGASRHLYLSQPAISQRLKQIEEKWGETLFIRTHKSLIPTPIGEEIILYAKTRIQNEKEFINRMSLLTGQVRGTLSLAVSSVIAQYYLPTLLKMYMALYPQVKIDLHTGLTTAMHAKRHDVHVSILRGDLEDEEAKQKLFSENLYYVSNQAHEETNTLIEFQSDPTFHATLEKWFQSKPFPLPKQTIKVDQIETCKQLMLNGIGACILPEIATKDLEHTRCRFIKLHINGEDLKRDTWTYHSEKHIELPQVHAFLDMLHRVKNESLSLQ